MAEQVELLRGWAIEIRLTRYEQKRRFEPCRREQLQSKYIGGLSESEARNLYEATEKLTKELR